MPGKVKGQVIGHDVHRDGRQAEKESDPDTPVAVRASPVRTRVMRNMLAIRYSLPVVTVTIVFTFTHYFPRFPGPQRIILASLVTARLHIPPAGDARQKGSLQGAV